jgi:hypothetical protein
MSRSGPPLIVTNVAKGRTTGHGAERGARAEAGTHRLVAYRTSPSGVRIVPAPKARAWMDATTDRFANRCLPLRMANQAGWFVLNDRPFEAVWDGGAGKESVRVTYLRAARPGEADLAAGHFGHGVLTFHVPYLIRTPPGYNLLARGPANAPKDGIFALEGLVEADWLVGSFTMNWRFTRPGHRVRFEEGEPICMILPQKRGELESFAPEVRDINDDLETAYDYWKWAESRWRFLTDGQKASASEDPDEREAARREYGWQKHYVKGTSPTGTAAREHQTSLKLRPFEEEPREEPGDGRERG